jgi:hypothetical protein
MHIKRRALYNLLRMNWQRDPLLPIEPWQVEDYRLLKEEQLFDRLASHDIRFNRQAFLAYADGFDSPEDMADSLTEDEEDAQKQDQVYLLLFEIWRRFVHNKTALSVFCDELDQMINAYDSEQLQTGEPIEDLLAQLQTILEESSDQGTDPIEVFESISSECANDVESFLYDYAAEQIDSGNIGFASDLVEGYYDYVRDVRWFDFLKARIAAVTEPTEANEGLKQIVKDLATHPDLDLGLEVLAFLVQGGQRGLFLALAKNNIPVLKVEADFQDMLQLCADYFRCLDMDTEEQAIQAILDARTELNVSQPLSPNDPGLATFIKLIDTSLRASLKR